LQLKNASSPEIPVRSQTRLTDRHDSARWDHYVSREGDTIVATFPKCGTTWMEHIVLNLFHYGGSIPPIKDVAPWVERRTGRQTGGTADQPIQEVVDMLARQKHRRQLKTHLPLDHLPFHQEVKYLVVARDARDACMSMFNHSWGLGWHDDNKDLREFWKEWIMNQGPDHFDYYDQFWKYRHLNNILMVHFNDLKKDLKREIHRVAIFLDIETTSGMLDATAEATTFTSMKRNADKRLGDMQAWKGGANTFINKGTNGRWREELTEEDLALYEPMASASTSPECRKWLEGGRTAVQP